MIALFQKTWANYVLKPYLKRYLQKTRHYHYDGLELKIYPGVFHPRYFFSTQALVAFLKDFDLKGKNFCEIGAGSGLISFLARKKGANVCAIELNVMAVKGLNENLEENFRNKQGFEIYHSDLFQSVPRQQFDFVFINPPWFFKKVADETALAWNCGENGEYFTALFKSLANYCKKECGIYMILSEHAETEKIKKLAVQNGFAMKVEKELRIKWEKNYIFKLSIEHGAGTG